jgi:hypothetical protein
VRAAGQKKFAEWHKDAVIFFDKYNVPTDYNGWTARREFKGHGLPNHDNVLSLINAGWVKRLSQLPEGTSWKVAKQDWYCNLSQSIAREPFGTFRSLCQSTLLYSYEIDTVLSAVDNVCSHGIPHEAAMSGALRCSDSELSSLAGEAFSCPCVTLVSYLYWLNPWAPWWHVQAET